MARIVTDPSDRQRIVFVGADGKQDVVDEGPPVQLAADTGAPEQLGVKAE